MVTTTKRPKSEHARCASLIRTRLKVAYPHTTFKVTSDSFAGGNSVDVNWIDGPTLHQVEAISNVYQYGNFDGSRDIYEITNHHPNMPQAKYVQCQREISNSAYAQALDAINTHFGLQLKLHDNGRAVDLESENQSGMGYGWARTQLFRTFTETSLVCTACQHSTQIADCFCGDCGTKIER